MKVVVGYILVTAVRKILEAMLVKIQRHQTKRCAKRFEEVLEKSLDMRVSVVVRDLDFKTRISESQR